MPAPLGNQNAKNHHEWKTALRHALGKYESGTIKKGTALREIAAKLIEKALDGDMGAIKEIADRLDGRPHQAFIEIDDNRSREQLSTAELEQRVRDGLKRIAEQDESS